MRVLPTLVAAAVLATSSAAMAAPAAPHKKPRPDLYVPAVTASYAAGQVTAGVYVTNKGKAKARSSTAAVYLSTDTTYGPGDISLGTTAIKKLRPKKTDYPIDHYAVTPAVAPGTYYVVACADATKRVKEKKEHNNCGSSTNTVVIAPSGPPGPPPGYITITWDTIFASVTASVTSGTGTCTAGSSSGSCTVLGGGATVRLVALAQQPIYFWHPGASWTGATCTGGVASSETSTGGTLTFTDAAVDKACTADAHYTS